MEFKNLTKTQKIPVLGLGTWKMGGGMKPDYSNDQKYIDAIKYAIKSGITHIDTAEMYGGGHTEELIGEAINSFDRKKLFITTKVSPHHLSYNQILDSCQNSLKRLKTKYIDLYLIHWPNPMVSMKNTIVAFNKLVEEKKIRFIGVSNFSVSQIKNAQQYADSKIVCNQVHFSLLTRDPEREILPFCQKEDIIVTAYSPLSVGELSSNNYEALTKIAQKYKKTPAQVALRWLIEKPNVIIIPKASSKEHIDELRGSLGWKMAKADQDYLSKSFS